MTNGLAVALGVSVLARPAGGAEALGKQRPHRFGHGVVWIREVELGPIARGEQDAAPGAGGQHALERGRDLASPWAKRSRTSSGAVRWFTPSTVMLIAPALRETVGFRAP